MNRTPYRLMMVLLIGSTALAACAAPSTPAPTSAPAATLTNPPAATLMPLPAPSDTPEPAATLTLTPPGGFPVGVYKPEQKLDADRLSFHADGSYLITIGPWGIPGTYSVDGARIVLNEGSGVCLNHPGTYNWQVQGSVLTLKVIDDTCTGSERGKDLSRVWDLVP